eukprot:TRINITY_DN3933_c0_g1_i2.p1 TRINITY_DN3933_c0_g1~~TRINITY_DN3933_c0_g1_i2.p1  ORF type:complete len:851 (-),score=312.85 TRINITY_DN3933_c0_g1_i2:2-2554(-)
MFKSKEKAPSQRSVSVRSLTAGVLGGSKKASEEIESKAEMLDDVEDYFSRLLKNLMKELKEIGEHSETQQSIQDNFKRYRDRTSVFHTDFSELTETLTKMDQFFSDLVGIQNNVKQQMEGNCANPLRKMIKEDLAESKEKKSFWVQHKSELDSITKKFESAKEKGRGGEYEAEFKSVSSSFQKNDEATNEYFDNLIGATGISVMNVMQEYLKCYREYFTSGLKLMDIVLPEVEKTKVDLQNLNKRGSKNWSGALVDGVLQPVQLGLPPDSPKLSANNRTAESPSPSSSPLLSPNAHRSLNSPPALSPKPSRLSTRNLRPPPEVPTGPSSLVSNPNTVTPVPTEVPAIKVNSPPPKPASKPPPPPPSKTLAPVVNTSPAPNPVVHIKSEEKAVSSEPVVGMVAQRRAMFSSPSHPPPSNRSRSTSISSDPKNKINSFVPVKPSEQETKKEKLSEDNSAKTRQRSASIETSSPKTSRRLDSVVVTEPLVKHRITKLNDNSNVTKDSPSKNPSTSSTSLASKVALLSSPPSSSVQKPAEKTVEKPEEKSKEEPKEKNGNETLEKEHSAPQNALELALSPVVKKRQKKNTAPKLTDPDAEKDAVGNALARLMEQENNRIMDKIERGESFLIEKKAMEKMISIRFFEFENEMKAGSEFYNYYSSYMKNTMIPALIESLNGVKAEEIEDEFDGGKAIGTIYYGLTQIVVDKLVIPLQHVNIHFESNGEITIIWDHMSASIEEFAWHYKKKSFPKLKDSGNATASLSDTTVTAKLKMIKGEKPEDTYLSLLSAEANIKHLDVKISGTAISVVYNLVLAAFKKSMKRVMSKQLEKALEELYKLSSDKVMRDYVRRPIK